MSAEQRTSSVGSPWEEIGYDAEEKLSGTKRARVFGKNGKNKKREEPRDSVTVGVRSVVASEPKLSSPNLDQANSEPETETKVFDAEVSTSSTLEPTLNNTSDMEVKKKGGGKSSVGSSTSRRRRNPNPGTRREKFQGEKEETSPVLTVPEEIPEVKEEKAEETRDGASNPEVLEVPGDISEDAGKNETFLNSPKPRIRRMAVVGNSVQSTPPEKQADQSAEIKQEDIVIAKKEQDNGVDWKDVQKDFDGEGKKIQEDRTRSMQFNRLDAQESFDEETKRLENRDRLAERFRDVKSFDELSVLLNDPEFPGIQGSKQFYSGDDLKRIIAMARETGATNFATRSHGFLDTVERLLREEKEGKTGALKEDDIVEGFGVVSEKVPGIVFEEDVKDTPIEDKMKNKTERGETFDAAISDDLKELYGKAIDAQKACDEAGRLYAEAQGREDSLRTKVYRIFPRLREKLALELKGRKSLVDLEREYQKHLVELRQIKVDIANQEAAKQGDAGRDIGKKMAEALVENNFRESVRMAELWAGEKRGDRRRMKVIRMAEDTVEWYRKLDPKVKIAFSGVLFAGTVVAGGVNWPLFVAALFPRMFGSAGLASVGRQLHERYALGRLGKGSDVERNQEWDEETLRQQANVPLEKFALYRKENQRRSRAWAGGGIALFLMGTGASYAGLARAAEHAADSEKVVGVVQQVLDTKPAGLSGSVSEVAANSGPTAGTVVKGAVETGVQTPGTGGLTPDAVGTGVIDHDVAAEIVGKIGKNISETSIVPEGSSFERVLLERLTGTGIPKEEAGKLADQAMRDFAEKAGKPFEIFNHIRPGAEIQYEIGSDGSLHVFGVTRKAGGEVIKRVAESVSGETPSPASVVQESIPLQSKPFDIPNASSPIKTLPLASFPKIPEVALESPQDILDRRLPNIPVPSLEDTLKGNVSPSVSIPAQLLEGISANASVPTPDFESLNLAVPGSEYLKNVGTIVKERLTFLPLSQTQKDLIENIFSARIPTANTEPTASSILFVRDTLGKALFSSDDVARWMQDDIEHVQEKVNKAVYAGLVRVGGESLRIGKMIAEGETVESWLTKMARHILMHRIGHAQ